MGHSGPLPASDAAPADAGAHALSEGFFERVYQIVRQIPPGRVSSYGQVARLAGASPRAARTVGWALRALAGDEAAHQDVPWWRVVNAEGRIRTRSAPDGWGEQRARLADEGLELGSDGRIDMRRYGWPPDRD